MFIEHDNYKNNRIILKLIEQNDYSEYNLKKIYHQFCKLTHPDITGDDGKDFILLQNEYIKAKEFVDRLQYFSFSSFSSDKINDFVTKQFYKKLYQYFLKSVYSTKIRLQKQLLKRNIKIIQDVVYWSYYYDKKFVNIFLNFNKMRLQKYSDWKIDKEYKKAKILFKKGVSFFFFYKNKEVNEDFIQNNSRFKNLSLSYFKDSKYYFLMYQNKSESISYLDFIDWFISKIDIE